MFLIAKFCEKMKMRKFGTKTPYLGSLGLEFQKTSGIFEISTIELGNLQNFVNKIKRVSLGSKMPYLSIFGLVFEISTIEFI